MDDEEKVSNLCMDKGSTDKGSVEENSTEGSTCQEAKRKKSRLS